MKVVVPVRVLCLAALAGAAAAALAQTTDGHIVIATQDVKWGPAPASIPPGAQAAVLYGDPAQEGMFALRLKLPSGYAIPPHTHPKQEVVTVISGTFSLGMGDTADPAKAQPLGAGGFFSLPPGMAHYASTEGETIVQLNSTGPWSLTYVDPRDDPRKKTQ
jgi:quercetin dioxygenase-like cupin family protein